MSIFSVLHHYNIVLFEPIDIDFDEEKKFKEFQ